MSWRSRLRARSKPGHEGDGSHSIRVAVAHERPFVLPTALHAKMWDVALTGQFHGLFMGVNRHASPAISELRFAEADARALHALFADTLGDGSDLLVGEDVTGSRIEARFQALAACGSSDVVVVSFSGHGSETHELVTYDGEVDDLAATCIPLALLTEWFSAIPARHLVCVLDCCFSGAMGAKVLTLEALPRDLRSEEVELSAMAGDGRLILTASTARQPAWEYARLGHGLLTHHLLEVLQGAPEVAEGRRLPVLGAMQHVTRRVIDTAAGFGREQQPTLRGRLDGELSWPVMRRGRHWQAAFPERATAGVTEQVTSLEAHGFPEPLLDAWRTDIPSLNELQRTAINDFGLLDGEHLLVTAPTSSGKTLVGELAALKGALAGQRALFLLPLKALVNDKHQEFERKYADFGIRTIRATGDFTDDNEALMRGQYDICLTTYEKATGLSLVAPHLLDGVGTIVVDEAQTLADDTRGANLEFSLTLLRVRRRTGVEPQVIALSAVIGDSGGLERWIGGRVLRHEQRPVPLDEGTLTIDGSFRWLPTDGDREQREPFIAPRYLRGSSQDWIIPLVQRLVDAGEQVIVFRNTKGATVGCATYLANALALDPCRAALDALPAGDPSVTSGALRRVLAGGVAFHNADLDRAERLALEAAFRGRELRVLVATSTLAMGVNTPASTVIIVELQQWDGTPYTVAEYKNMVGRAGRLGFTERGRSVIIATDGRSEHAAWQRYVLGRPEDLRSRFLDADPRALILRTLAAAGQATPSGAMTAEELVGFLEDSWGVFQQRTGQAGWSWSTQQLPAQLAQLERLEMVAHDVDGRLTLLPLGRLAGEAGVAVETIVRLADTARTAGPLHDPASVIAMAQLTAELDEVFVPVNSRGWRKEAASWYGELGRHGTSSAVLGALRRSGDGLVVARRAKRALGCLLWAMGAPRQEIEALLMRHHRDNAIAGPVQTTVNRTIDLLPTTLRVLELVHGGDIAELEADLLLRLQLGIPSELTELGALWGDRLTRPQYLALRDAGLTSPTAAAVDPARLAAVLGIEREAAQDLIEVPAAA
jgi:helicase